MKVRPRGLATFKELTNRQGVSATELYSDKLYEIHNGKPELVDVCIQNEVLYVLDSVSKDIRKWLKLTYRRIKKISYEAENTLNGV